MNLLLSASNIYVTSIIAFFATMQVVGFFLMRTDHVRHKRQMQLSIQMEETRKKKPTSNEGQSEPKKAKKKKKYNSQENEIPGEERVSNRLLITMGIFFGGVGELFAMIIFKHKWYKWAFRTFMPLLAILNIIIFAVAIYFLSEMGDVSYTPLDPAEEIVKFLHSL